MYRMMFFVLFWYFKDNQIISLDGNFGLVHKRSTGKSAAQPNLKTMVMTEEKMKNGNMAFIFGISFLLSILLAFFTQFLVIHEMDT